jgi:hypothetical protein
MLGGGGEVAAHRGAQLPPLLQCSTARDCKTRPTAVIRHCCTTVATGRLGAAPEQAQEVPPAEKGTGAKGGAHTLRAHATRTHYAHTLRAHATRTRYAHKLRAHATRTRYAHKLRAHAHTHTRAHTHPSTQAHNAQTHTPIMHTQEQVPQARDVGSVLRRGHFKPKRWPRAVVAALPSTAQLPLQRRCPGELTVLTLHHTTHLLHHTLQYHDALSRRHGHRVRRIS